MVLWGGSRHNLETHRNIYRWDQITQGVAWLWKKTRTSMMRYNLVVVDPGFGYIGFMYYLAHFGYVHILI